MNPRNRLSSSSLAIVNQMSDCELFQIFALGALLPGHLMTRVRRYMGEQEIEQATLLKLHSEQQVCHPARRTNARAA